MFEDLAIAHSFGVNFHILRDRKGLYLIDCGFLGGRRTLDLTLQKRGWSHLPILGILATHGHLDHILNISRIAAKTGSWVAAPRLDSAHYAGHPSYRGLSRITGCLESIGRPLLNYQPFTPSRYLDDGDFIDIWHGLRVIHLPGHTAGHSGYYCEKLKLLFCGDLFASYPRGSHLPPRFLNLDNQQAYYSAQKVLTMDLLGILPNHADSAPPDTHLTRIRQILTP